MNNELIAKNQLQHYLGVLQSQGIKVSALVKAQFCYESELNSGPEKLKIRVYFGSKGVKTVLQGNKSGGLYRKAENVIFGEKFFEADDDKIDEPDQYIGTDESGKGDFFGPLVIAGVLLDGDEKTDLKKAGVKDSKLLSDNQIKDLSGKIIEIAGSRFSIVLISPARYNELYDRTGNLNKLLAWGHSRVIENILEKHPADTAISDKFGDESLIKNSLMENGKLIKLHQFHKAESYTAVAAASILARNEVNKWFIQQSKKLNIEIPKGASSAVEKTASLIIQKYGGDVLQDLVKTHFKTIKKISGI